MVKPLRIDPRGRAKRNPSRGIEGGDIFQRSALKSALRGVEKGTTISDSTFKTLGAETQQGRQELLTSLGKRLQGAGRDVADRRDSNLGIRSTPGTRLATFSARQTLSRGGTLEDISSFARDRLRIGNEQQVQRDRQRLGSLLGSRNRRDSRPNARGSRDDTRSGSMFGRRRRR